MRKTSISKLCMASMAFVSLSLASCMEKDLYSPQDGKAPSLATFATTQDVQFSMKYDVPAGYASGFDVYTENPVIISKDGSVTLRTDIEPIAAGITESGSFSMLKRLPGYVKELYVYSNDLFAPRLMHANIENGNANFSIISLPESAPATSNMVNTRAISAAGIDQNLLPVINDMHVPTSLLDGEMEVPYAVLNTIAKTFPGAKQAPAEYIHNATLEVKEDAQLWITPLITDASMVNTLGYFCYNGDKSLDQISINTLDEKMLVVFPWARLGMNDTASGLKIGQRFKLKYYDKEAGKLVDTFPKGTKVIWFLYGGIYDRPTRTIGNPKNGNRLYSESTWNAQETNPVYYPHTTYYDIKYNNNTYTIFGFEDQIMPSSDRDFNDLVFMMQANPSNAITPPVEIPGDDNEPKVKTESRKGILAFEDNWPWEGDYDLNDVVVKYNSVTTYATIGTSATYVDKITDTFTLLHSGASYHNSFSIKYDFAPSKVRSITVNGTAVNPRADGDGFVVDVCPDVIGAGILTPYMPDQSYDYNIVMSLGSKEMSQTAFQTLVAPYNPYISPSAGLEVHLPMYAPTTGADTNYFGTKDDRSVPSEGIYYVGKENSQYPWAIHLSGVETFSVPDEKLSIDHTYPRFIDWVKSGFTNATDWYKN